MADIAAVLLVPAEGDPLGLLMEGPCGARPPVALRIDGRWFDPWAMAAPRYGDCYALVLKWEGEVVSEGILRVLVAGEQHAWLLASPRWRRILMGEEDVSWAWDEAHGVPGTIILLDADGQEVPGAVES